MDYLNEEHLVEKPIIEYLESMGYAHIFGESTLDLREFDEYGVILKPVFIDSLKRLNNITTEDAERLYMDFIRETDNEKCIDKLRGNFSFLFTGEKQKRTVNYIDYDPKNIENNTFNVVSQMTIKGVNTRRPDLIIFVNGIPLVVIECKSPIANQDIFSGITQIHEYERDLPKLFYSNAFNVATDGKKVVYGATGASSKYYLEFKDPYPKKKSEFKNALEMGCYCVLEPERLLDLLHNFILFEVRDRIKTKKICRYQQYRAVNKIVNRVIEGSKRKGLIWHTQGSGKSLTMFYTAYKLKLSKELNNPNILLITDRIDLDDQISKTFVACGFRNPKSNWIYKHYMDFQSMKVEEYSRDWESGERVLYRGKKYNIRVFSHKEQTTFINFNGKRFEIFINENVSASDRKTLIEGDFRKWYMRTAYECIKERLDYYCKIIGLSYNTLRIKEQKTRWGSCSKKGNLNFNWKLIMSPPWVIDYIVIHEVCHLRYLNHSKEYWAMVGMYMPNYKKAQEWLKKNGLGLTL